MTRFVDTGATASSGLGDYSRGAATFFGSNGSTYTWTVPAGVTEVFVNVFGSGGRGNLQSSSYYHATGGGGGGYAGGVLTVTPGSTYTITNGQGGMLASGTTVVDGTDTTFKDASNVTLLTGGGGKGGNNVGSGDAKFALGGRGGVGTVNSAASFKSSYTANGGRGGDVQKNNTSNTANLVTGGGASGSLSGDGGRGGDIFRTSGTQSGWYGTGGGGWAQGDGGDILSDTTPNSSSTNGTGGGGFMNSGGGIFTNSGSDFQSSGGSSYDGGTSWERSIILEMLTTAYNGTSNYPGAAGIAQSPAPASSIRRSWWNYMTGEALNGQRGMMKWGANGDGVGGWGTSSTSWGDLGGLMVPGFGGGHGGTAYYNNEGSQEQAWYNIGKGRRVGGGAGAHMYYSGSMNTAVNNALDEVGDVRASTTALARAPFGGGGGGGRQAYGFGGGDGFVVICYK